MLWVLSIVTRYDKILVPSRSKLPLDMKEEFMSPEFLGDVVKKIVFPAAARGLIDYLIGGSEYRVYSPEALFYVMFKLAFMKDPETTRKLMAKEKKLNSTGINILAIASSIDLNYLTRNKIVMERKKRSGGKKEVEYILQAPLTTSPSGLEAFLVSRRGIDPSRPRPRNSVDMLHLLEYYAVKYDRDAFNKLLNKLKSDPRAQELIDEAKGLAILTCRLFEGDPEQELAKRLLSYFGEKCWGESEKPRYATLDMFSG